MSKTKTHFVIVGVAIFFSISGTIVGHIMQAHQSVMWLEGMSPDQDARVLKLIKKNKAVLEKLKEQQEAIEDFLNNQRQDACTS